MNNEKDNKKPVQEEIKDKQMDFLMKNIIIDGNVKLGKITKKIIETINGIVTRESRSFERKKKLTKRFTDIEERLNKNDEAIKDHEREIHMKGGRSEMNKKIEKKEIEILGIIDEFKKDRWENEEEVDAKFNSYDKDIQELKKTVEDLKKIVKEQEKTIFDLKYPNVA